MRPPDRVGPLASLERKTPGKSVGAAAGHTMRCGPQRRPFQSLRRERGRIPHPRVARNAARRRACDNQRTSAQPSTTTARHAPTRRARASTRASKRHSPASRHSQSSTCTATTTAASASNSYETQRATWAPRALYALALRRPPVPGYRLHRAGGDWLARLRTFDLSRTRRTSSASPASTAPPEPAARPAGEGNANLLPSTRDTRLAQGCVPQFARCAAPGPAVSCMAPVPSAFIV
jgi:hypothetical protein